MTAVKCLTLGKLGVLLLLCLSLQHHSVNSHPCPGQAECTKVDESVLADLYNSRHPGAYFYSSCLYLLPYIVPVQDSKSNATMMMPRYVGLVSTEGRCVNLNESVHDQVCLSTSHLNHESDSYCDWSFSLRYLGENYFPRYVLDLKCNNFNRCRAKEIEITVQVLKRQPDCTEEGLEKWSNAETESTTVVAGCSCTYKQQG